MICAMHCFALEVPVLNVQLCEMESSVPLRLPHTVKWISSVTGTSRWRGVAQ
jgi:hypothetical protein